MAQQNLFYYDLRREKSFKLMAFSGFCINYSPYHPAEFGEDTIVLGELFLNV
jgi:hypothetical protein